MQQPAPPLPSRRQRAICSSPHPKAKAKNAKFSSLAHDADSWSWNLTFLVSSLWLVSVTVTAFRAELSQWLGSSTSLFDWPFDDRTAEDFRENVLIKVIFLAAWDVRPFPPLEDTDAGKVRGYVVWMAWDHMRPTAYSPISWTHRHTHTDTCCILRFLLFARVLRRALHSIGLLRILGIVHVLRNLLHNATQATRSSARSTPQIEFAVDQSMVRPSRLRDRAPP